MAPADSYVVNAGTRAPTFPGFGSGAANAASWVTPIWRIDYFVGARPFADRKPDPRSLPAPHNGERWSRAIPR
jgi:hypothetical protein